MGKARKVLPKGKSRKSKNKDIKRLKNNQEVIEKLKLN